MTYPEAADAFVRAASRWMAPDNVDRVNAVQVTLECSNTFTPEALDLAIDTVMRRVRRDALDSWIRGRVSVRPVPVAVLNAGNVPFVGLQDLLAVVCTGHEYVGVLSSKSPHLLSSFATTAAEFSDRMPIRFADIGSALRDCEAVIATGSDSTVAEVSSAAIGAGVIPDRMLLRGTRISVAVLDGTERADQIDALASDALLHEGRGCLNVAIVFAPDALSWEPLMASMQQFRSRFPAHPSTLDAIGRQTRLFRATGQQYDERVGSLLVKGEPRPDRPGIVVWSGYTDIGDVETWIFLSRVALRSP